MEIIRNNITKAISISIASVIIASVLSFSSPASSTPVASAQAVVACGDIITQSLKLAADIGPCSENGITIGVDNITLDCNGHTVSGSRSGFATGITLPQGVSGVTIKNCEVIGFGGDGFTVIGRSNTLRTIQLDITAAVAFISVVAAISSCWTIQLDITAAVASLSKLHTITRCRTIQLDTMEQGASPSSQTPSITT